MDEIDKLAEKILLSKYERIYELASILKITVFEKAAIAGYVNGYKLFEPVLKEEELSQEPICYARELAELFRVLEPVWDEVASQYEKKVKVNA